MQIAGDERICVRHVLALLVRDGVIVPTEDESPPLDATRGHGWNGSGLLEYVCPWLVICFNLEAASVQILVEFSYAIHNCESFLVEMIVVPLRLRQRVRCKPDWPLFTSWQSVREHSPQSVGWRIAGEDQKVACHRSG